MDLLRIGEKIISRRKIDQFVGRMLELRAGGLSQTEVAHRLGVDRTLVSRLESLGEVRKGRKIAVVGFPVQNKEELRAALQAEGVDFILLMTEAERWDFVRSKSGIELVNLLMDLFARAHNFDQIVVIGSNKRIKIIEAVLDKVVVGYEIGESPIQEDKYVDPGEIIQIVRAIKGK
ncbi:transcriptional regulator [Desulfofundulus thermobenzoicus]|uniref:Transcriptional regulator n=1 Tax=Desulfofundulus thermobenzoicus TaxID=29376 RepID=A0A6N7IR25_9FIRM|nr:helix-turn-helix transcriptional regulator [Desulfofundulus thermobenzoicus]MQL51989.1 transcriptional regulator [Desulfofundulus thermobenzoicus]HHW44824.1 helix-turn-helix domain-containing protein [Desulfotomaculum sp.]